MRWWEEKLAVGESRGFPSSHLEEETRRTEVGQSVACLGAPGKLSSRTVFLERFWTVCRVAIDQQELVRDSKLQYETGY